MASLTNYYGLQIVDPPPSGAGGLAINNDFKALVEWNPKSVWDKNTYPGSGDDITQDFMPGSQWFVQKTNDSLFQCIFSDAGAAVWSGIPLGAMGLTVSATTTDTTATELTVRNGNSVELDADTTWAFTLVTVARRTDTGSDSAAWESTGVIKRDSSGAALVGTPVTSSLGADSGASTWNISIAAVGSSILEISVTGEAGATIDWTANLVIRSLSV